MFNISDSIIDFIIMRSTKAMYFNARSSIGQIALGKCIIAFLKSRAKHNYM